MYYISHHGIKGQRWGVRRYQNDDGSYTNTGKRDTQTDGRSSGSNTMTKAERKQAKRAEKGQKSFERGNRIEDIYSQKQKIHSGLNKATPVLAAVNAGLGYAAGNRYNGATSATASAAMSALSTIIQMKTVDFVIGKIEDTKINDLRAYYQREGKYGQYEPKKNYA